MKVGKLLYIKHKRFFEKKDNIFRVIGNINNIKHIECDFFHIVDLDDIARNFDVYDKLTYIKTTQVESKKINKQTLERLYGIEARVSLTEEQAIELLPYINNRLSILKFEGNAKLLNHFKDILINCPPKDPSIFKNKRIFCMNSYWDKAFAIIN